MVYHGSLIISTHRVVSLPLFVTILLFPFLVVCLFKAIYPFPEMYQSLWVADPRETLFFLFFLSFISLRLPPLPPLTPPHRDEAQSRWQMWEPEQSCEAGVPLVLADEILVCSKQQQGHFLSLLHSVAWSLKSHDLLLLPKCFDIFCLEGLWVWKRELRKNERK